MPKNRLLSGLPVLAVVVTFSLLTTAACGTVHAPVMPAKSDAASRVQVSETYGKLPVHFEANQGQTDEQVKFLARGKSHTLFLTPSEAVVVLTKREQTAKGRLRGAQLRPEEAGQVTSTVLRMTFVGANLEPRLVGRDELPGKANYFIGNDRAKWRTNVPTYAKVHYQDLYPGIDLIYYGNGRQLEYDFVVGPGADPNRILLCFQGADRIEVDSQGDLVLHTAAGTIRQRKPVIYQEVDGVRREISGGYVLKGACRVGFRLAAYDASRRVVIDPALFYSTYLGGSREEEGHGVAVDITGNAYVTGFTMSTDFPTTAGVVQPAFGGGPEFARDAFVTKLNPTGSGLVYSTYLGGGGGNGEDDAFGIAVDTAGNAYVTGLTTSTDFPTTPGAFQTTLRGGLDVFVTKLNPTGSGLVYSTYLGGSEGELGLAIAVDTLGNAYVTGDTLSFDFPTTPGAFQTTFSGVFDAFVTKLNPTGTGVVYSTYLGGSDGDVGVGIAVDTAGNTYVTGATQSTDFPTTPGAFQVTFGGGSVIFFADAFVTKLNPLGTGVVYSTYLGGSDGDAGNGVAVDTAGNAYVTGITESTNFPTTPGAFQTTFGGVLDAFVTKLNSSGSGLYSTYLGGSGDPEEGFGFDEGIGIAVDTEDNAYVTGLTSSTNFPTTPGGFQPTFGGVRDAFVTKLNPTGSGLVYSTYFGGNSDDFGRAIGLDALPNPNVYLTGATASTDFPTTPGAFQTTFSGGFSDVFVAKITEAEVPPGPFTARVTGGGTINVAGGIGTFSFIIQQASTGELSGRLQYINHASGARVRSVSYNSLLIVGNTATFDGTCTLNGAPCMFTVNVSDNGEPGTTDTFTISYSPPTTDGGTLRSGNILITQ
jgi:hypothetical protein